MAIHLFVLACTLLTAVLHAGTAVRATAEEAFVLRIQPDMVEVATDEVFALRAELIFDDGAVLEVTEDVVWESSSPRVARVDNSSGRRGNVTGRSVGEATISIRDPVTGITSDQSGGNTLVQVLGRLSSLQVTPRDRRIELGETKSMTASGTFTGGAVRDLTDEVFWASSNRNVVAMSNEPGSMGHATALAPGVAFISATSGSGISSSDSDGDARVRVPADLVSIRIVPSTVQLPVEFSRSLDAEGTFDDGSVADISNDVDWFTSNRSVVTVSNEPGSQGEATALKSGVAVIRAVDPETGISSAASDGDAVVVVVGRAVAISISPADSQLPIGFSQTFAVRAVLDDGSLFGISRGSVEWTSSNPSVAMVSNESSTAGLVTALAKGETILSALHPVTGLRSTDSDADARLTVVPALEELLSLEVTPRDRSVDLGETKSMTATGAFRGGETADLTDHVLWTSSDPRFVVVSNDAGGRGRVTAKAPGVAFISAAVPGVLSSSDSDMDARIRVLAELVSIRVVPGSVQLPVEFARSFDAEGTFLNGSVADVSNKVDWFTTDSSVVTVSNEPGSQGEVTAIKSGVAFIRAVDPETGISSTQSGGDAQVTVAGRAVALSIRPSDGQLPTGLSRAFSIDATLEDGSRFGLSRRSVEWTSSSPSVALVSNESSTAGLVTALAQGETWLSAVHSLTGLRSTDSDGDARLTVVPALEELASLEVTPSDRSIDLDETRSMTATGVFPGGVTAELTDHVVWTSSNPAIAMVSNDAGSRGQVTAKAPGVAFVSAAVPGIISSSDSDADGRVRVIADLVSIRIAPSDVELPAGAVRSLDATGTFVGGLESDLSNKVTWLTSDPSIVAVSNEPGSQGEITALEVGVAVISAVHPETGISSTASANDAVLTVRGRIVALSVRPSDEQLPVGISRKFSVRAILEDGSFLGLSRSSVEWTSSNPAVAIVNNTSDAAGLVTPVARGETTISVVYPLTGIGSTDSGGNSRVTVPGSMVALEVRPRQHDLFIGQTKRFSVFALLDTGTDLKLSEDVEFSTSNPSIVSVSNESGQRGDAKGLAVGNVSISATHLPSGLSSSTTGGDATVSVDGSVQTLHVDPPRTFYLKGTEQKVTLRATFEDGSTSSIGSDVVWTSSDPSVAEVGNESPNKGVLVAKAFGTVTISAVEPASGVSTTDSGGDGVVTVVEGIEGISVRAGDYELRTGDRPRLRAFGSFPNPEPLPGDPERVSIELTDRVEWTSGNPTVIQIEEGRALAVGLGDATVSAYDPEFDMISTVSGGDAVFRVLATLRHLVIKPKSIRVRLGANRTQAFRAIGRFTDGARLVLTDQVEFVTTDPTIAAVSNESGAQGDVLPVTRGRTKVTAVDPITGVSAKRARRLIIRKAKR